MAVLNEILTELERAITKFPTWPTDPLHALAVVGEEYGELTKAMLQLIYEPRKSSEREVRTEAIQLAAMALRLTMSLKQYNYKPAHQHVQNEFASEDWENDPAYSVIADLPERHELERYG